MAVGRTHFLIRKSEEVLSRPQAPRLKKRGTEVRDWKIWTYAMVFEWHCFTVESAGERKY